MLYILLLTFISNVLSADKDCAHFGAAAVNTCLVFGNDGIGEDAQSAMIECVDDDNWSIKAYTDNQCEEQVTSGDGSGDGLDVSILCTNTDSTVCDCGDDTALDDCYITIEDYKACNDENEYTDDDLYASLSVVVNECVTVGSDDDSYDPEIAKYKKITCTESDNVYEPWIETIYEDSSCSIVYKEPDYDCSTLTKETVTCNESPTVETGEYCGVFEGHPLGVCTKSGEFVDSDDTSLVYSESVMYVCDGSQYYEVKYYGTDCESDSEYARDEVECGDLHNCVCDTDNTGPDCGYTLFSYTATGFCRDNNHPDNTGTATYSVTLSQDACFVGDDELTGIKYQCDDTDPLDPDLTFTIYFEDRECDDGTSCTYSKSVNCEYQTGDDTSCNYYQNYPVGECSKQISYTDTESPPATTLMSVKYTCNTDGTLQQAVYPTNDCTGTPDYDDICVECDEDGDNCEPCTGYVCSADTNACDLVSITQTIDCTIDNSGDAAEQVIGTELVIINECQTISNYYRKDTCSNEIITQSVYEDSVCSNLREECSISEYEGDYGLNYEEQDLTIESCDEVDDDTDCGFIDQFPINTCVVGYKDAVGAAYSAMYTCSGDNITALVYGNDNCEGDTIFTKESTCTDEGYECNCDSNADGDKCSTVKLALEDTCLETDTFMVIRLPPTCQYIDDIDDDWSLYVSIECTSDGDITYGIYEDDICTEDANILRYKDESGCTHYVEYKGVCGEYPVDDDPPSSSMAGNININSLFFWMQIGILYHFFL